MFCLSTYVRFFFDTERSSTKEKVNNEEGLRRGGEKCSAAEDRRGKERRVR